MAATGPHRTLDKKQFEDLFKSHFQYLCNFARQYVRDEEVAQDLTQKVFIKLWEKREELDPQMALKSYLFTAVKNRCLNYLRDQKTYRSKVLDIDCGDLEFSQEEDPFAADELAKEIEAVLNSLPPTCRKVFEMSRYQELKYKEIAEELEVSQKTVEAHMSKALKTLRGALQRYLLIFLFWMGYF